VRARRPGTVAARGPSHRLAECCGGGLSFAHQYLDAVVRQRVTLLDEPARGASCFPRPVAHVLGESRAPIEMAANTLSQIPATMWTQIRAVAEKVRA